MCPQLQFPPPSSLPASNNQFPGPHPAPATTTSPLTSTSPKSLESPQTVGEGSFLDGVMVRLAPLSQPQPQPQLRSWSPLIRQPWKRRGVGWGRRGKMLSSLLSRVPIPPSSLSHRCGVPLSGRSPHPWSVEEKVNCLLNCGLLLL